MWLNFPYSGQMPSDESNSELITPAAVPPVPTLTAPEDLKVKECIERQVEMDAIASYGNQRAFPSVAGAFVEPPR